jgi:hypothetical protein
MPYTKDEVMPHQLTPEIHGKERQSLRGELSRPCMPWG